MPSKADARGVVKRINEDAYYNARKPEQFVTGLQMRKSQNTEAYRLAFANAHKPWARRWLRKHWMS